MVPRSRIRRGGGTDQDADHDSGSGAEQGVSGRPDVLTRHREGSYHRAGSHDVPTTEWDQYSHLLLGKNI